MAEDFAARVIAAHQAGLAEARQAKLLEQQQEDRDLQRQILKHGIDRLKIEDALQTRGIQMQNAQLMEGQPATSTSESVGPTDVQPVYNPLPPQQISGVPATATTPAVPGVTVQPRSLQEHLAATRLAEIQKARDEAMFKGTTTAPGATTTFGVPGLTPTATVSGGAPLPTDDFGKYYLPAYAQKLGKTVPIPGQPPRPTDLTSDEQIKAFSDFAQDKQDPELRQLAEDQKRLAIQNEKMMLGMQPTKDDIQFYADQLLAHKTAPSLIPAGFGTQGAAFKRAVEIAAMRKDPDFNMQQAEADYHLVESPQFQTKVRTMDAVTESIPRLEQNFAKLGNGKFRTLNEISNAAKNQFNDKDLKAAQVDATLVGDEIGQLLGGGGSGNATSDAKLNAAWQLLKTSDSVPAIASAIKEVQFIIGNRRKALTRDTYMEAKPSGAGATEYDFVPGKGLVPRKPGG